MSWLGKYFLKAVDFIRYIAYSIGAAFLLLACGHFLIGLIAIRDSAQLEGLEEDSSQMREFHRETERAIEVHFEPYYHWKGNPSSGSMVNVDAEGYRKTVKSSREGAARVFCLGGSTMWGRGVPDQYTIPSMLQAYLGGDYNLHNLGQMAFVAVQEQNLLLERLSFGDVPDIAIFYDGVNDGYAGAYSPAIPRDPQMVRMERQMGERWEKGGFFDLLAYGVFAKTNYRYIYDYREAELEEWGARVAPDIEENVRKSLDAYEEFVRQVKGIAAVYDFEVFFFWQPNLFSLDKKLTPYELQILEAADDVLAESQHAIYWEARKRFVNSEEVVFLGDLFAGVEQPVYIDFCHVRPRGNKKIVEAMLQSIQKRMNSGRGEE
jgi:hypothetical protein